MEFHIFRRKLTSRVWPNRWDYFHQSWDHREAWALQRAQTCIDTIVKTCGPAFGYSDSTAPLVSNTAGHHHGHVSPRMEDAKIDISPDLSKLTLGSSTTIGTPHYQQSNTPIAAPSNMHVDAGYPKNKVPEELAPDGGDQDEDDLFLKNANPQLKEEGWQFLLPIWAEKWMPAYNDYLKKLRNFPEFKEMITLVYSDPRVAGRAQYLAS